MKRFQNRAYTAPGSNGLVSADLPLVNSYLKSLSLGFVQAEVDQNLIYQDAIDEALIVQTGQPSSPLYFVDTLTAEMLVPPDVITPNVTTEDMPTEGSSPAGGAAGDAPMQ